MAGAGDQGPEKNFRETIGSDAYLEHLEREQEADKPAENNQN